jgi:hypothetical protein
MGGELTITERLEISPEDLVQALEDMEKKKRLILCDRCNWSMHKQTVMIVYEFGHRYVTEYYCTGKCGNRITPIPQDPALGKFIERRKI